LVQFLGGKENCIINGFIGWRKKMEEKKLYKAKLVINGFAQKKGIDFDEIFSPVVKMNSIKTILSLVAVV
jgi:hypothetical protein